MSLRLRARAPLFACALALLQGGVLVVGGSARAQALFPIERPFATERERRPTDEAPGDRALEGGSQDAARERVLPSVPAPSRGELEALGPEAGLVVRELELVGNTVFSDAELMAVVATDLGRPLDANDLERIRRALTAVYVAAGYQSSGARLPAQEVRDGRLRIEIVEGRLDEIRIEGAGHYREEVLRDRLRFATAGPLRVGALDSALHVLAQDPRIERLDARLEPGPGAGTSILRIVLEERELGELVVAADNHATPKVGEYGGHIDVAHGNPLGRGDRFDAGVSLYEGLTRVGGRYAIPIHPSGTQLAFESRFSRADIVSSDFNVLEIASDTWSHSIALDQTLYRTPRDWLEVGLAFDLRRSQTSILGGDSFPFSEGTDNGRSELSVLRATTAWTHRRASSALTLSSVASFGLDAFGATMHHDSTAPDGIFVSWIGQLRFVHRFERSGILATLRGDLQLADRALLPLEQFAIGGPESVRGYRTNQLVGDGGFAAALDLTLPLWRTPTGRTLVAIVPFADVGRIWNDGRFSQGKRTLSGLGAGLEWMPRPELALRLDWGGALRDSGAADGLQEQGVTFRVSWRVR